MWSGIPEVKEGVWKTMFPWKIGFWYGNLAIFTLVQPVLANVFGTWLPVEQIELLLNDRCQRWRYGVASATIVVADVFKRILAQRHVVSVGWVVIPMQEIQCLKMKSQGRIL